MKTLAAVLKSSPAAAPYAESRPLVIEEVELDPPGPEELLIRIEAAGLCDAPTLHACLTKTAAHPRCRLPRREVDMRLKRYLTA